LSGFFRRTAVLGAFLSLIAFANAALTQQSVTLAWNADSGTNIASYNLYYGSAPRTYTNAVSTGNVAQGTVPGLNTGATYYFAVTAVDNTGLESDYSNEVTNTVTVALAKLKLRVSATKQAILDVTGTAGQSYNILSAPKMGSWTNIGTMTIGTNGAAEFIDPTSASQPVRFYRLLGK